MKKLLSLLLVALFTLVAVQALANEEPVGDVGSQKECQETNRCGHDPAGDHYV